MREDVEAPLCQVVDALGHADAVIDVRVADGKHVDYGAATEAMVALAKWLPVRYVEL